MSEQSFIDNFSRYAKENERIYKIPSLVSLSQSALETNFGESTPGNMLFGIKAGSEWTGQKQLVKTTEYHKTNTVKYPQVVSVTPMADGSYKYVVYDWFRKYSSPADSFTDYAKLISSSDRYKAAFNYTDPYKFAGEIVKGGYATDPNYYNKVSTIITSLKKKVRELYLIPV
jgi:flagellum-specific peptidoglycan hydrolase FlgJ